MIVSYSLYVCNDKIFRQATRRLENGFSVSSLSPLPNALPAMCKHMPGFGIRLRRLAMLQALPGAIGHSPDETSSIYSLTWASSRRLIPPLFRPAHYMR